MDAATITKLFDDLVTGGLSPDHAVKIIIAKLDAESRYAVALLYVTANQPADHGVPQKES